MSDLDTSFPFGADEAHMTVGDQIPDVVEVALTNCCEETVRMHAAHNPMMVCPNCKQFIKCFTDDKSCRNYIKFCKSRHRKLSIARYGAMQIVMYRAFTQVQSR